MKQNPYAEPTQEAGIIDCEYTVVEETQKRLTHNKPID